MDSQKEKVTLEEAKRTACVKAMGDLLGINPSFSAVDFMRSLPEKWQAEVDEIIYYVYQHEKCPDDIKRK